MGMTDPIADMLTRIRNGSKAGKKWIDVPASRLKKELARILAEEHFIEKYKFVEDKKQGEGTKSREETTSREEDKVNNPRGE